jgi:hypothetical protein
MGRGGDGEMGRWGEGEMGKVIPNIMDGIEGLPFIPAVLELWAKIANVDV